MSTRFKMFYNERLMKKVYFFVSSYVFLSNIKPKCFLAFIFKLSLIFFTHSIDLLPFFVTFTAAAVKDLSVTSVELGKRTSSKFLLRKDPHAAMHQEVLEPAGKLSNQTTREVPDQEELAVNLPNQTTDESPDQE